MSWLDKTDFTIPEEYGTYGAVIPFVHWIDANNVVIVFRGQRLADEVPYIYAWHGTVNSAGTLTLDTTLGPRRLSPMHSSNEQIVDLYALPDGGYAVYTRESTDG